MSGLIALLPLPLRDCEESVCGHSSFSQTESREVTVPGDIRRESEAAAQ